MPSTSSIIEIFDALAKELGERRVVQAAESWLSKKADCMASPDCSGVFPPCWTPERPITAPRQLRMPQIIRFPPSRVAQKDE